MKVTNFHYWFSATDSVSLYRQLKWEDHTGEVDSIPSLATDWNSPTTISNVKGLSEYTRTQTLFFSM